MPTVSRKRPTATSLSFIPPQLPTPVDAPPEGEGWLHEIKHDGNRTQLIVERGKARAFTRNGHDWSELYPRIVEAAATLSVKAAILDGEVIVQDERGVSDFPALKTAIAAEPHRLLFFAFDLLHLDGMDLRKLPLLERKAKLATLLSDPDPLSAIQLSEAIGGDGQKFFAAAEELGLEGIVSKRASSRYKSGPSPEWLKTKCMTESEFVVVGMEPNPGGPPFALLAREENGALIYAGSAFVTLPQPARDRFWNRTEALKIKRPAVKAIGKRKAGFVKPELRVRAKHLKGGDILRHASLTALLS